MSRTVEARIVLDEIAARVRETRARGGVALRFDLETVEFLEFLAGVALDRAASSERTDPESGFGGREPRSAGRKLGELLDARGPWGRAAAAWTPPAPGSLGESSAWTG